MLPLLLVIPSALPASAQAVEGVAAIVNDEVISTYDVRQRMRLILATTSVRVNEEILMRVQEQALNSLIEERLQLQEAAQYEIEVDQAEVDNAIADIAAQNNLSAGEIRRSLAEAGVDPRTLEDQLRAQIAWDIMVSGRYRSRVRVSNDQIEQMLQREAESASKPRYLLSEILLAPTAGESEAELVARAEGVLQQLEQGALFPALAREFSAAASAIAGGDMSWVRAGEIKPEIERALATMQPGTFSEPIVTQDGVYIIAYRDRQTGSDPERVALMQVFAPAAAAGEEAVAEAARALGRAANGVKGCEQLNRIAERLPDASIADLGSIAPSDLAPEYRSIVAGMSPGDLSAPIRGPNGAAVLALCSRDRTGGANLPSREEIENRLLNQQLSLASRRWLRDLRRDATIETRVGQ